MFCDLLVDAGSAETLDLQGIQGGSHAGLAELPSCRRFRGLGIETICRMPMAPCASASSDLLGDIIHDMRDSTVKQFRRRYQVEIDQASGSSHRPVGADTQLAGRPAACVQFLVGGASP